jgi:hypothetical protein
LSRIRSPVTSRSNCANESSTLSVSRPIDVVVLDRWVTATNDSPRASNTSTILAKSASERFPGRRLSVRRFAALAEFVDTELRQTRDFRRERIAVGSEGTPRHDCFSSRFAATRSVSKLMCDPPLGRSPTPPMTHTLLASRRVASPSGEPDFARLVHSKLFAK